MSANQCFIQYCLSYGLIETFWTENILHLSIIPHSHLAGHWCGDCETDCGSRRPRETAWLGFSGGCREWKDPFRAPQCGGDGLSLSVWRCRHTEGTRERRRTERWLATYPLFSERAVLLRHTLVLYCWHYASKCVGSFADPVSKQSPSLFIERSKVVF